MVYSVDDIAVMREGGQRLARVLNEVVAMVAPGVTTADLDAHAAERMRALGGEPSFLGYTGSGVTPFPSTLCTSVNREVVHAPAVPGRVLQEGDIVGLDIGMRYPAKQGFCTDMAMTVGVGQISSEASRLIQVTREALELGIQAAQPGRRVSDISRVIQQHVEGAGFSVVYDFVGHGVGRHVHEPPEVPNFVIKGPIANYHLTPGLVIAIEPMVNAGKPSVKTTSDQWTVVTKDKSLSAQFEHTIAITESGSKVLTAL